MAMSHSDDDIKALDAYLQSICDRQFAAASFKHASSQQTPHTSSARPFKSKSNANATPRTRLPNTTKKRPRSFPSKSQSRLLSSHLQTLNSKFSSNSILLNLRIKPTPTPFSTSRHSRTPRRSNYSRHLSSQHSSSPALQTSPTHPSRSHSSSKLTHSSRRHAYRKSRLQPRTSIPTHSPDHSHPLHIDPPPNEREHVRQPSRKSKKRPRVVDSDDSDTSSSNPPSAAKFPHTTSQRAHKRLTVQSDYQLATRFQRNLNAHNAKRTKALDAMLSFAHRASPLSSVDGMTEPDILKRRQTLATIQGCEYYEDVSIFVYCKALCHHHNEALRNMEMSYDGTALRGETFDELKYEAGDGHWNIWIAEETSNRAPPWLSKTVDAAQFMLKLLGAMANIEDEVSRTFIEGWYRTGLTSNLATLTLGALRVWTRSKHYPGQHEDNYSNLLDWCLKLVSSIIVYELSPSSFIYKVRNLPSEKLFISVLHGSDNRKTGFSFEELLSASLKYLASFPSNLDKGKECKSAVAELIQVFIVRKGIPWRDRSPQSRPWEKIQKSCPTLPEKLCGDEFFWSQAFTKALQQIRREPTSPDSSFEIGFVANVVSTPLFMRELLQNQSKCLGLLGDVMTNALRVISWDPQMCFLSIMDEQKSLPSVPTILDLIPTLMSSAVMQRELIATDEKVKKIFLESVDALLARSARLGSNADFDEKLERLAEQGPFATPELDAIVGNSPLSDSASQEKLLINQRVLAFSAHLLGSMGRSLVDGSRDMSQMNSLKAFLFSKANSNRNRRRTFEAVLRIQGGLERNCLDCGTTVKVLSTEDRNRFSMVVEGIRKHLQSESRDALKQSLSADEKSSCSPEVAAPPKSNVRICFPRVTEVPALCYTASKLLSVTDLDDDPDMIMCAQRVVAETAQQTLARYDPDTPFTWKWVRLHRRNTYIDGARELLEKNDRAIGQKCSCLPGNPKGKKDGSENRVACSNDLCENRLMRIECVPGECGAGSYCKNQRLQRLDYAKFKMLNFPHKGVGLIADEEIKAGSLIGEYQGEIISTKLFKQRMREYQGERHFYFMTLTNKLVIDASRKSQATRFLNHSCDPNAETQKWNAGGEPRVGIFAARDIVKGEEITFDYGARSIEKGSAPCVCDSSKCRGTLTSKQEDVCARMSPDLDTEDVETTREKSSDENSVARIDDSNNGKDVAKIVQEKIKSAKRDLDRALELEKLAKEKRRLEQQWNEATLSPTATIRFREWKETVQVLSKRKTLESSSIASEDMVESDLRIPRRSAPAKPSAVDVSSTGKARSEKAESQAGLKNNSRAESEPPKEAPLSLPRIPRRSVVISDPKKVPSVPVKAERADVGSIPRYRLSSGRKIDTERPLSRAALIGREKGFQPSSTRLKRKPVKPRINERQRSRKQNSDSDSMDQYSTASEAEPVLDEPQLSPSGLPDGKGARSDDEFVPEPPFDPMRANVRVEREMWTKNQPDGQDLNGTEPHMRHGQLLRTENKGLQGPEQSRRWRAQRSARTWEHTGEPDALSRHDDFGPTRRRDDLRRLSHGMPLQIGVPGHGRSPPRDHGRRDYNDRHGSRSRHQERLSGGMSGPRRGPSHPNDHGPFVFENSGDGVGIPPRLHEGAREPIFRGHDRRPVTGNGRNTGHGSHGHDGPHMRHRLRPDTRETRVRIDTRETKEQPASRETKEQVACETKEQQPASHEVKDRSNLSDAKQRRDVSDAMEQRDGTGDLRADTREAREPHEIRAVTERPDTREVKERIISGEVDGKSMTQSRRNTHDGLGVKHNTMHDREPQRVFSGPGGGDGMKMDVRYGSAPENGKKPSISLAGVSGPGNEERHCSNEARGRLEGYQADDEGGRTNAKGLCKHGGSSAQVEEGNQNRSNLGSKSRSEGHAGADDEVQKSARAERFGKIENRAGSKGVMGSDKRDASQKRPEEREKAKEKEVLEGGTDREIRKSGKAENEDKIKDGKSETGKQGKKIFERSLEGSNVAKSGIQGSCTDVRKDVRPDLRQAVETKNGGEVQRSGGMRFSGGGERDEHKKRYVFRKKNNSDVGRASDGRARRDGKLPAEVRADERYVVNERTGRERRKRGDIREGGEERPMMERPIRRRHSEGGDNRKRTRNGSPMKGGGKKKRKMARDMGRVSGSSEVGREVEVRGGPYHSNVKAVRGSTGQKDLRLLLGKGKGGGGD